MKNITIMCFLLVAPFFAFACKDVYKYAPQTNPDGTKTYRDVNERWQDGNGVLECYWNGSNDCKWKDGTPGLVITVGGEELNEAEVEAMILDEIQAGNLTGTVFGDETGSYSWSAVSVDEYNFSICDGL